jgi:hypothetical protein
MPGEPINVFQSNRGESEPGSKATVINVFTGAETAIRGKAPAAIDLECQAMGRQHGAYLTPESNS